MFTGSGAAGKTNFRNLLMKKKFVNFHHSTNIVNTKHAISIKKAVVIGGKQSDDQNVVWLEMDDNTQISHLQQVLLSLDQSFLQKTEVKKPKPLSQPDNSEFTNLPTSDSNNVQDTAAKMQYVTHQSSTVARVTGFFKGSVKSERMTSFDSLSHNISKFLTTNQHSPEVLNIITLLDTGGQPEYIHLLPTVNIHPMVNFVVHDLSKSLEDQVLVEYSEDGEHTFKPYHLKYSNFDTIRFLMSSINDSLERTQSQVPQLVTIPGKNNKSYLCCVGTHSDKVDSNTIQNIDGQLTLMVEKLDCKAAVWQNKDGGVLFPVDNTTAGDDTKEDPIANLIRNKIDKLSTDKDIYELPITWMLFELEICQDCANRDKPYISLEDCCSIASQTNLVSGIDEVKNALMYHHLLGVLLYYPDVPGLCNYIILDHQWLFDRISTIVCFTLRDSSTSNMFATSNLKYNGILTNELIQEMDWKEELKEEYFIALLIEMKIVAPINRKDCNGQDYFIPYVLPTCNIKSCADFFSQYGYIQGEPLLIQFASNLLPRGFFCCISVEILQKLPKGWNHLIDQKDVRHTYSNLITFRLHGGYSLSLMDKLSYLEVQLRHEEKNRYQQHPIHVDVLSILASALIIVCKQLTFNHERLQYGFHCQCKKYDDEHIAVLPRLIPPFDYAMCRHGSFVPTKLKKGHTVWLTAVSG